MKKLLLLGLGMVMATVLSAQVPHRSYSLLNSAVVSLTVSNTFAFTNLSSATSQGTNAAGLYWTNTAGSRVTVATNTGAGSWANATTKVVDDIPLWSDRNGQPVWEPNTNSNNYVQSGATLAVTMVGGSGANTASTWVFTPVYDGVNEATAAAELWTIAFTPTTTTVATLVTNVPTYRWPGAKLLRLVRVVPGDTDASSQVTLLDVNVNGFVPVP